MDQTKVRNLFTLLLVAALAGVGFYVYKKNNPAALEPAPLASELAQELGVEDFSLSGTVTALSKGSITVKTGQVERINGETKFVEEMKEVLVTSGTVYIKISKRRDTFVESAAGLADIKVGSLVTIHTSENFYAKDTIEADRIDIQ